MLLQFAIVPLICSRGGGDGDVGRLATGTTRTQVWILFTKRLIQLIYHRMNLKIGLRNPDAFLDLPLELLLKF